MLLPMRIVLTIGFTFRRQSVELILLKEIKRLKDLITSFIVWALAEI